MAAASNIYKEAAVPLATAIVSNYILVSLDTRTYTAYVHTNTQTLPLQPTKKSLPCRLTRGGTWSDANTVSVCVCVLITVSCTLPYNPTPPTQGREMTLKIYECLCMCVTQHFSYLHTHTHAHLPQPLRRGGSEALWNTKHTREATWEGKGSFWEALKRPTHTHTRARAHWGTRACSCYRNHAFHTHVHKRLHAALTWRTGRIHTNRTQTYKYAHKHMRTHTRTDFLPNQLSGVAFG